MPRCEVKWLAGRTLEQQDTIAKKITDAFVDVLGCSPQWVNVVFRETDPKNYYTAGVSEAHDCAGKANQSSN